MLLFLFFNVRLSNRGSLIPGQKADALKTFLLPSIDFILLKGDVGESRLEQMDQHIRASINEELRVRGLPVEYHHASWRDGGLTYQALFIVEECS
jgi:hypothetical protein